MRLPHHLLRHPSGVFHFRIVVPRDLREALGFKVIKRSLRTRDPAMAQACAYALGARYAAIFALSRSAVMPKPPPLADILRSFESGEIRTYTLNLPNGLHVRADGPEDHARALEALRMLTAFPTSALAPSAAKPKTSGITLGEASRKYVATLDSPAMPDKTKSQKRAAVNGFTMWKGEKVACANVTRTDVSEWIQSLRNGGLATPTIANKQSYLKAFFEWAQSGQHYPGGDNPATNHIKQTTREKRLRRREGFRVFTPDQLARIYSVEAMRNLNEPTRWGAVLGLYTGARVSEVGQIALSDFLESDGVWCVSITDEGHGQSLKNDASKRVIPIHRDLLHLGLRTRVDFLKARGERQLFPNAKPGSVNGMGNWLSTAYTRHLASCGVKAEGPGKIGFHSLRKTAIATLKRLGVTSEVRAQYVGHDLDDEHHGAYGSAFTMREMLDGVVTDKHTSAGIGALTFGLDVRGLSLIM